MKKTIITFFNIALIYTLINSANAQTVPQAFNYQAVARDNSGNLLANQIIGLRFTVLENNSTIKYIETHTTMTNQFGLLTVSVGNGTAVSGTFSSINWSTGNYWLKIDMDPNGGSSYSSMGLSQLLTVPFAMYAASSGGGSGTSNWNDNTTYLSPADNANAYVYDDKQNWVFKAELKNTNTGSEWTPSGCKAAVFGKSNNKSFQAGVYGNLSGYANNEAGVIGSIDYNIWGALGYLKNSTSYALYVKGNIGIESGSYRTAIVAGTQSTNITYTLPSAQGAANTYLKNNGSGALSWATVSGSSLPSGTSGQTLRYDGSNWVANSLLYNDGLRIGIGTSTPSTHSSLHVASHNNYAGYFSTDSAYSAARALFAEYTGTNNGYAVYGKSSAPDWYGYGGYFESKYIGAYGYSNSSGTHSYYGLKGYSYNSSSGESYGIYGSAYSSSGVSYGIYGNMSSSGTGTKYGVYCSGNGAYTGTWTNASDKKFKKDITDYSGALDNIVKLKPVTYTMKTEEYPFMGFASGAQIGFIAQDIETVFPSLVEKSVHPGATEKDTPIEYKGVNYIGLIPVLVKAMQEQQLLIKQLQQDNKFLKEQIQKLLIK